LEHAREKPGRLVGVRQGDTADELLEQGHVLIFAALARQRLVEEFYPEADQVRFLDLARFEDAVQLQVRLPIHLHVLVLHIDALGDEDSLVDVWQAAREERAELYEVVDSDAIFFVLARVRSALLR